MAWTCKAKRDWPVGPDRAWNADAAEKRIAAKAGMDGDNPNMKLMAQTHMFTDSETGDTKGLFCDVVDGEIMAMPGALKRGWGRMMQADVPERAMAMANEVRDGYMAMMGEGEGDMMPQRRNALVEMAVKALAGSAGENSIDIWVSREEEDRDREILLSAGAELENFLRNPVVLWAHDAGELPIAKAPNTSAVAGQGVAATWEFSDLPFAQEVKGLYKGGFLNAASHGFRPLEIARRGDGGEGLTILRWELLEQSAVAVPANALALAKAFTQGSDLARQWLADEYPELWGANASADPQEQAERVRLSAEQRVAENLARLKGASEGLRNHARHLRRLGLPVAFDLGDSIDNLVEVVGHRQVREVLAVHAAEDILAAHKAVNEPISIPAPEPHPAAGTKPTEPPAPEPHPAAGAPSEQDLPAEVLAGVEKVMGEARQVLEAIPATVAAAVQTQLDQRAKSYIGRRVPTGE